MNTDFASEIQYSENVITTSDDFGTNSAYFTAYNAGVWMMAADVVDLTFYEINGGLGADGDGFIYAFEETYPTTAGGTTYRAFVKGVSDTDSDPTVNHLILIPDAPAAASQSFSNDTNEDEHRVAGLAGVTRIYQFNWYGQDDDGDSFAYSNAEIDAIVQTFISLVVEPTTVVNQTAGPSSGSAFPVGDTEVTFTATDPSGNSSDCSFTVRVEDNELPQAVNCPADTTLFVNADSCRISFAFEPVQFTDNCSEASILFVSDNLNGFEIPGQLEQLGFDVTTVFEDYVDDITEDNTVLQGDLSSFDMIYWNASGENDTGDEHSQATTDNLLNYVLGGGHLFVTGFDVIDSPDDPNLIALLGGSGTVDQPNTDDQIYTILGPENSLNSGLFDIIGLPIPSVGDEDGLLGLNAETIVVLDSDPGEGARWALRTTTGGQIAWVSTSNDSPGTPFSQWETLGSGYFEALRNFAFNNLRATPFDGVQTAGPVSGSSFELGTTTITFTGTDPSGNDAACSYNVTVLDTIKPVVVCRDTTIALDANGIASLSAEDLLVPSTVMMVERLINFDGLFAPDNFPDQDRPAADYANGEVSFTTDWEVLSRAAGSPDQIAGFSSPNRLAFDAEETQLRDTIKFLVPAFNVSFLAGTSGAASGNLFMLASAFNENNELINAIGRTLSDEAILFDFNTTQQISAIALSVNRTDVIISIGGIDDLRYETPVETMVDNCPFSLVSDQTTFTCADVGDISVVLMATDDSGNEGSCVATVTVTASDQACDAPPLAICIETLTVELDEDGNTNLAPADLDNGSSDVVTPDEDLIFSFDPAEGLVDCDDIGTSPVSLIVTDNIGQADTCFTQVTVEDNIAPAITCQNVVFELQSNGRYVLTLDDIRNTILTDFTDNCTELNPAYAVVSGGTNLGCNLLGESDVMVAFQTGSGQEISCDVSLQLTDPLGVCGEDPIASCRPFTISDPTAPTTILNANVFEDGSTDDRSVYALVYSDATDRQENQTRDCSLTDRNLGQTFTAGQTGVIQSIKVRSGTSVTTNLRLFNRNIVFDTASFRNPDYVQEATLFFGQHSDRANLSVITLDVPFPVVAGQEYTFAFEGTTTLSHSCGGSSSYSDGQPARFTGAFNSSLNPAEDFTFEVNIIGPTEMEFPSDGGTLVTIFAVDDQGNVSDGCQTFTNPGQALPVSWLSFSANAGAKQVDLQWETTSAPDNAGFHVERSATGHDWAVIGQVAANDTEDQQYFFTDNAPFTGSNYYRIRQTDLDGRVSYSHVETVEFSALERVTVYPNPATDLVNIRLPAGAELLGMLDVAGKRVDARLSGREGELHADVSRLPDGVYVLRTRLASGRILTNRLVVH